MLEVAYIAHTSHDVASELLLHEVREVVVHALPFHRMHMRVVRVRMLIHKVLVYLGHGLALQPVLSAGSLFVNYPAHCLCIALHTGPLWTSACFESGNCHRCRIFFSVH